MKICPDLVEDVSDTKETVKTADLDVSPSLYCLPNRCIPPPFRGPNTKIVNRGDYSKGIEAHRLATLRA